MANPFDQFDNPQSAQQPVPGAAPQPQQQSGGLMLPSDQAGASVTVSGDPGVMGYVQDVVKGLAGGALDAGNATLALPADLGEATGLLSKETAATARKAAFLPELSKQETTVGEITRQITKFGVGFIGAGKIMAPIKAFQALKGAGKLGSLAGAAAQGAVGDFMVSDPHEARLADLIESVPALENPITEYLASNKTDGAATGRFKAALEGIVPGVLVDSVVMGVKGIAKARKLRAAGDLDGAETALAKSSDDVDRLIQKASKEPIDLDPDLTYSSSRGVTPSKLAREDLAQVTKNEGVLHDLSKMRDEVVAASEKAAANAEGLKANDQIRQMVEAAGGKFKGVSDMNGEKYVWFNEATTDSTGLVKLSELMDMPPKGHTRLYRVEGPDGSGPFKQDIYGDAAGHKEQGVFFSESLENAKSYLKDGDKKSKIVTLDVPTDTAALYRTKNQLGEYLVPVDKAKGRKPLAHGPADAVGKIREHLAEIKQRFDDTVQPLKKLTPETKGALRESLKSVNPDALDDFVSTHGIFNYTKMDSAETVHRTLDDFSRILADDLPNVAGTHRTLEMTQSLAAMMGGKSDQLYAAISRLAKDAKMIDAYLVGGKAMMQSLSKEIADLATKIDNGKIGSAGEIELVRRADILADLMDKLGAVQTGAARATSAGRIRTTDSVKPEQIADLLDSVGGSDAVKKVAAKIRMVNGNPQGVIAAIQQMGTGEKLAHVHNYVWINGILSGAKTHVVNAIGNTMNTLIRPAQRILGGMITGDSKQAWQGVYQYMALRHTIFDSLEMAGRAFKQNANILDPGNTPVEMSKLQSGKIADFMGWQDKPFAGFINTLGQASGIAGRLLNSSDEFFKQINYRSHVIAEAWAEGMERGLQGDMLDEYVKTSIDHSFTKVREVLKDGTETMRQGMGTDKAALRSAQEATFTQSLKIDVLMGDKSIGQWMAEGASVHPMMRATVLPFVKVPTNLFRTFVDNGPIALATKRFHQDISAGGERAAMAMGKITTGSALWVGAGMLAAEGRITGMGPQDKDLQRQMRSEGWQPYSFVTYNPDGTKNYTSFQKLDPYGMFFGLAADMAMIYGKYQQGVVDQLAMTATVALAGNLASKSYLRGLTDIMGLLGSGYSKEESAKKWLEYRVASYIPSWTGMVNPDTEMKETRSMLDAILARLPGASSMVEAKRDNFGQKFVAPHGYPYSAINPFTMTTSKGDAVREELSRLAGTAAEARFPMPPVKPWGEGIDLTQVKNAKGQSAYDRWMELHDELKLGGKNLHGSLADLISSDAYKGAKERMGDGSALFKGALAVDLINKRMEMYRNVTLQHLQQEMPELRKMMVELQTGQKRARVLGPAAVPAPQFILQ